MVIGLIGESCTGKSTAALGLKKKCPSAVVYSGKDYIRLDKNEENAKCAFVKLLNDNIATENIIIYVISEKEHITFLPKKAVKVLFTADIKTIKERFAKRTNGILPPPLATALEKKHGIFNNVEYDLRVDTSEESAESIIGKIIKSGII